MSFVHLHSHTEYSLLDGANKIKEYVAKVKKMGMTAAAITDHGVMYGVIEFYRECLEAGINPVLGCEVYVAPGSRFDREAGQREERYHHLILLAENDQGYQNLMKIVSAGFIEGYYYKPRVDKEILSRYHEGIIASSACLGGEVPSKILAGQIEAAKKAALEYLEIFGKDHFYLELQDHGMEEQRLVNHALVQMSQELGIPLICTNDCHYTNHEDEKPHDILLCLQTGKKLSDPDRMRYAGGQYYVKSEEEMRELFPYALEAIEETQRIADRCHVEIEFHKTKLPHFDVPEGYDALSYLTHLCYEGLEKRYPEDDGTLKERLDQELQIILKMGYVDYFLIVWDYIHYAKNHGIAVGPGRGSAAGAIVSYCLGITDIDPIKYNLLFERFLNPERVSMPDIDVDFDYERRQEVIEYVVQKYGRSRCVQIVTFNTLAAKGVIRDVCRAMDLPYSRGDQLARMVPREQQNITLEQALESNNEFRKLVEEDEEVKEIIDMCMRLEGLPRHSSTHAAGILITPEDADQYVPLSRGGNGEITTQFTMTTLEELGLLKMDFLGLRTLTVIKDAVMAINKRNPGLNLDIMKIDYDDPKVMEYISTGSTEGIFQLESGGMQVFMKKLKPNSLEDIIAGIALYRPGPMDFIPKYIEGKNHSGEIKYDCPELKPILESTYGCIVYQEQVMQIVQALGGYTLGRADIVRRAMSKKKKAVMEEEQANFVYGNKEQGVPGCVARGIPEDVAKKIYGDMMDFARYAFNKSHAASYAYVTMQTAWLKTYYPVEFMAALMTSFIDNSGKVAEYILVCRSMGISILPPDINFGGDCFQAEGEAGEKKIRFGMLAVRSVGSPVIRAVLAEREHGGRYKSLGDFIKRTAGREVNKRAIESLIKAGAMDSLGGTRKQYIQVYESLVDEAIEDKKKNLDGQMSLMDLVQDMSGGSAEGITETLPDVGEFPKEMLLNDEKEVLGVYLSGHPLEEYEKIWKRSITAKTLDFSLDENGICLLEDGSKQVIGGIISDIRIKQTKKGDTMAIIQVEDLVGTAEVIVWPKTYSEYRDLIQMDQKVIIEGRVKTEDERDAQLMADRVRMLGDMPMKLYVQYENIAAYEEGAEALEQILRAHKGQDYVIVYCREEKKRKTLGQRTDSGKAAEELQKLLGMDNIKIV